jgi:acetolactate synthase small subunit
MVRVSSERARAPNTRNPQASSSTACFSILAESDPGVMPRVLELFAKRGLVPTVWHSKATPAGELTIDIQMADLEGGVLRHIAQCLRQICGVSTVLTAEKG